MSVKNNRFNVRSSWWDSYVSGKSKVYNTGQLNDAANTGAAGATGGTKTTPGDGYHYHHFYATVPGAPYTKTPNTSETFQVGGSLSCDILLVAGGGAGGYDLNNSGGGGGGGAGAVYYATGVTLPAATYPVTVGGGGQNAEVGGPTTATPGDAQGDDTVFNGVTVAGGGRGGRGAISDVPTAAGITGGCGGGGGSRFPGGPPFPGGGGVGGPSSGAGSHPGSSNLDAVSPPVGWGYDGAAGAIDTCNCASGGGGGGIGGAPYAVVGNYNPGGSGGYSIGGHGGIGAKYTIDGASTDIGGGGMGGAYSAAGNQTTPPAHPFGGAIQDSRDWPAPMRIYPAPTVNIMFGGLDGSGGGGVGGCAGSSGLNPGAPSTSPPPASDPWSPNPRAGTSAGGRGGCGLVQIRYPV